MYRRGIVSQISEIRKITSTTWQTVPRLPSYLYNDLSEEHHGTYNKQQRRNFKNFGHKPQPESLITKLWCTFVVTSFIGMALDWKG
jgi:hypothetical protein